MNQKMYVSDLWNDLVTEERETTPRNYIYASELGQSFVDRLLKMRGVTPTNPFTSRVLRIFDCGNIFEVEVMERIFRLLGIFISSQTRMVIKTPKCLDVVGKHDPKIGGKINKDLALSRINRQAVDDDGKLLFNEDFTPVYANADWLRKRAEAVLKKLLERYPNGMETIITEIKSVNSQAFWSHKNQDEETGYFKGYPHHKLQLHTYVKKLGIPGRLFYISKDDLSLMETPVEINNKDLEILWVEDVKKMTEIYTESHFRPLLQKDKGGNLTIADWLREYQEPNIIWNENKQEFEKNWKVLHSGYLTLITGFADEDVWDLTVQEELKKANVIPCKNCGKEYTRATLNKNDGICGRCVKQREKEAAQLLEDKKIKEAAEQTAVEDKK